MGLGNSRLHYKMYKDGKKWVFAGLASITLGVGLIGSDVIVHADVSENFQTMTSSKNDATSVLSYSNEVPDEGAVSKEEASSLSESVPKQDVKSESVKSGKTTEAEVTQSSNNEVNDSSDTDKSGIEDAENSTRETSVADSDDEESSTSTNNLSEKPVYDQAQSSSSEETDESLSTSGNFTEEKEGNSVNSFDADKNVVNSDSDMVTDDVTSDSADKLSQQDNESTADLNTNISHEEQKKDDTVDDNSNSKKTEQNKKVDINKAVTINSDEKVVNNNVSAQNASVSDPDYPKDMWVDPDQNHYSFYYLLSRDKRQQIILSTNRAGSGIVYVHLIDARNKNVLEEKTLEKGKTVNLSNGTKIYNDDYTGLVAGGRESWSREYATGGYNPGVLYNKVTFFVPKLITQTVSYVDENGNNIVDVNGHEIKPITQDGLTGQKYTTDGPKLVNGYYNEHYLVIPENASGTMSQFGTVGDQYVRDFHNGYKIVFTEVDGKGTMDAKIYDAKGNTVYTKLGLQKDQIIEGAYKYPEGSITVSNPYVDQTKDVRYVYRQLGSLVPDVPGVDPVPYPNDPTDP
ncbi:KxYKxGKxW signal peptide domain-containing protein, partial [Weissella sagaensis]